MKRIIYTAFTVVFLAGIFGSCSKESLDPILEQNRLLEEGINTQQDLFTIVNGAYDRVTATAYYGRDYIIYGEVRSDNCWANGNSGRFVTVGAMDMGASDGYATDTWTAIYDVIASVNLAIEQDPSTLEGDLDAMNHLKGQAYALRAMAHFDLLRLYGQQHVTGGVTPGGIPYITEFKSDNLQPERDEIADVYSMVQDDLDMALSLMSEPLNDPRKEFFTTYGVYALKSRVATYFEDWETARDAALEILASGEFSVIPEGDFVKTWYTDGGVNSIFELAYSNLDNNNINGLSQIYRGAAYGDVTVLDDLLTIFDATDIRASAEMIGPDPEGTGDLRNLGKYPSADYSDNIPIFRYEEAILDYVEALFELGETPDPSLSTTLLDLLNSIPENRGASLYTEVNKDNIMLERRKEFCFEGHRFNDLARTGSDIPLVDPVHQEHGGPEYGSFNYAFPIPRVEMNANSKMIQNYGYN